MSCLWSLSTTDQGQCPGGFWDGLLFINNDIQLASDPRYGQVYHVRVNDSSQNPWWNCGSTCSSSELSKIRPTGLNSWDWYVDAIKVEPGFACADWGVVDQFNYPTLSSPPVALALNCSQDSTDGALHFGLDRNAGSLSCVGCQDFSSWQHTQLNVGPFVGKWVEFIVGVYWATDNSGQLQVYTRVKDNGETGFTQQLNESNIATMQYITGQPLPTTTIDHYGLYFGYWSQARTPSPFPTNYVDHMGLERFSDKTSAFAAMG